MDLDQQLRRAERQLNLRTLADAIVTRVPSDRKGTAVNDAGQVVVVVSSRREVRFLGVFFQLDVHRRTKAEVLILERHGQHPTVEEVGACEDRQVARVSVIVDVYGVGSSTVVVELVEVGEGTGGVGGDGVEAGVICAVSGDDGGVRPHHHDIQDMAWRKLRPGDGDEFEAAIFGLIGGYCWGAGGKELRHEKAQGQRDANEDRDP